MTSKTTIRRPGIRSLLFRLHAWLGLYSFLILFLLFATGTLLVFIDEIEALIAEPQRLEPAPESKDEGFGVVYDGLAESRPDVRILYIIRSKTSWIADQVRVQQRDGYHQQTLWVDPISGENLGEADFSMFRNIVRGFHDGFVIGRFPGNVMVTLFSLPLLYFIVSGLIAYRRFWRGFFRLPSREKGSRAFWGGLHRLLALWTLPFLLIMGITSFVYLLLSLPNVLVATYPEPIQTTVRSDILPKDFDGAALDRSANAAREAWPELDIEVVVFPRDASAPIKFMGSATAFLVTPEGNAVTVDPVTQSALEIHRGEDLSLATRIAGAAEVLHYGIWGGLTVKVLWLLFGIMTSGVTLAGAMVAASRIAGDPEITSKSAVGRLWHGMNILKWGLILFLLAVTALVFLRFGPF